jgi:glycosyltransferase involved in cell wall biosynthesis
MRILFIAGEYPPLQGGLGAYTRELARALVALGHEVHILTKVAPGVAGDADLDGIREHRRITRWGWLALSQLNACIHELQPDVLNLQYQAAAYHMHPAINLLPRFYAPRIATVVTFHDLKVPYLFPKAGPLRERAILDMARCATATIVTNMEDHVTLTQARINREQVAMIPIGSNITPVKLNHFDRAEWLGKHGIPAGAHVIGYFGFMNESKGGETLVRALAELRNRGQDVTLLLIGGQTGESDPTNIAYANYIMQVADDLHVRERIALTGFVDDQGVTEAFTVCDCVALPYRDGVSFRRGTLMAALAHGSAVVTTTPRVPVSELQDAGNMLLVPPDDPGRLAEAVQRVLVDPALRARLQAGSAQLSRLFTWDRIAEETVKVYAQAITS